MRIGESSGFKFNIFNMKQEVAEEENSTHQQVVEREPQGHSFSQRNMMADSFFKHDREESRYITGMMTAFDIDNDFRNRMQNVVDVYKAEADLVRAKFPGNNAALMLVGMKAERAAKDEAEDYTGEKMEEKIEEDRKEREEEQEKKTEEKIEEKLTPEGSKKIVDTDPDPAKMTEEIAEKAEEATESQSEKVLKGNEPEEGQTVTGNVQAAEQVSTLAAAGAVEPDSEKKVELTGDSTQTVEGGSSAVGAVPPPGTYVDEVV
ncbi:hypothetical protein [Desulfovibrio sp. JC010]|uniref:hypothetical protein n=1 Tax=Desulfovibrio sp. JC010 TaxID=2593641 RepID=UPI0013D26BE0|nr:hypothetical protein [Desulfovibrio sp. JC010]NDV25629.1 hypothetical protein [Desulfovibrio sp. JC010]